MASRDEFEPLIRDHLDGLFRLGRWISGDPEIAEELVQEACLRAYRRFDTFDNTGSFKAWINRILTNYYIDRYRRKKRTGTVTSDFREMEPVAEEVVEPAYFEADEALTAYVEHVDDAVKDAIEEVPETFRTVFLLFGLAGFSYKEIAATLDIPMGTVMSRLYRARQILKDELRSYAGKHGFDVEEKKKANATEDDD